MESNNTALGFIIHRRPDGRSAELDSNVSLLESAGWRLQASANDELGRLKLLGSAPHESVDAITELLRKTVESECPGTIVEVVAQDKTAPGASRYWVE